MKKILWAGTLGLAILGAAPAWADANIEGDPTAWRLQNYVPNMVVAYYTGSNCPQGSVTFSPSATADDKNRFFSMVLAAKMAGKKMGVFYETASGACQITSFYTL